MEPGNPVFGYTICMTMPDESHMGGVLVTDIYGLPLEFRHTDPVTPSRLQKVLYGRALEAYIANEVLVGALLSTVVNKPELYIAADSTYVSGAAEFGSPAVWLAESRNGHDKEVGHKHEVSAGEYILQLGPGNGALRVKVGEPRGNDTVNALKTASELTAKTLLAAGQCMEILEPMARVTEAVQMVWEDAQRALLEQANPANQIPRQPHARKAA